MNFLIELCIFTLFLQNLSFISCQNLQLPTLLYEYDALEPYFDKETMQIHHLGHHAAYTKKLNNALRTLRDDPQTNHLAHYGIDKLLQHLDEISSPELRKSIRNNGGGFINHEIFFNSLSPANIHEFDRDSKFGQDLIQTFDSFQSFQDLFTSTSLDVFGSGWTWLIFNIETKELQIMTTFNQDTPATQKNKAPLLCIDLWEHAYYLKFQKDRKKFIDSFWNVINWEKVNERYQKAVEIKQTKEEL